MEKEKGIPREDMIHAIASAISSAAEKGVHNNQNIKVSIDPKTGALKAWSVLTVVDSLSDPDNEIHIQKAREVDASAQVGDMMEQPIDPAYLGRIAASAARQAITQNIRQFEKDRVFDDFKDQIGDIVSGVIRRRERGDLLVEIGKVEAYLRSRERIPGEDYAPGERIRCLLLDIENTARGPELVLSRAHPQFVRKLFELEVSEITDGTVTIEKLAREAGYRTKMCVQTTDSKVDPVGACVGARGARVKAIVRELGGEKVDVIRYHEDPQMLLMEAMKPAELKNVEVDEKARRISFEVQEGDLSIAIGRKGQNVKLTSQLIGYGLDVAKAQSGNVGFEEKLQRAVAGIHQIPGISDDHAQRLVANGITTPEAFEGVTGSDLVDLGFNEEEAADILSKIDTFNKTK